MGWFSPDFRRRISLVAKRKTFRFSMVVIFLLAVSAIFSEWITNSKPVVASINGRIIFPAYVSYNRPDMGLTGAGVVDYRELKGDMKWAVWPVFDWDPYESDYELDIFISPPSKLHPMGTDVAGRDVFARLIYGTRVSFIFAISVWLLSYLIGTVIGLMQGYRGGWIDLIGQRLVEIFSSIPTFYLLIMLITMVQPSVYWLIPISTIFGWVGISQYMRAEALRNRRQIYAEAASSLGASSRRVLFRHILPNSLIPIITFSPFAIVGGISALAGLDFLGFGVPAPTPSWGELLDQASKNFEVAWWLAFFPSLFLFLSIVSLNLVGEALRTAFDPRS